MGKCRFLGAILIRIIFLIHAMAAVWFLVYIKDDHWYWYMSTPLFFLFFEGIITLTLNEKREWNWYVCLSTLLIFKNLGYRIICFYLFSLLKLDPSILEIKNNYILLQQKISAEI